MREGNRRSGERDSSYSRVKPTVTPATADSDDGLWSVVSWFALPLGIIAIAVAYVFIFETEDPTVVDTNRLPPVTRDMRSAGEG